MEEIFVSTQRKVTRNGPMIDYGTSGSRRPLLNTILCILVLFAVVGTIAWLVKFIGQMV